MMFLIPNGDIDMIESSREANIQAWDSQGIPTESLKRTQAPNLGKPRHPLIFLNKYRFVPIGTMFLFVHMMCIAFDHHLNKYTPWWFGDGSWWNKNDCALRLTYIYWNKMMFSYWYFIFFSLVFLWTLNWIFICFLFSL